MSQTNYARAIASIFPEGYTPDSDGAGAAYLALQILQAYDSTDATDAQNVFQDAVNKLSAFLDEGNFKREVLQLLNDRASQTAQGF
jgi:hypothetical protein